MAKSYLALVLLAYSSLAHADVLSLCSRLFFVKKEAPPTSSFAAPVLVDPYTSLLINRQIDIAEAKHANFS